MKLNGNLSFHTLGSGEIRNAIIERLTTVNRNNATHSAGRIVFDTDLNTYYFSNGSTWTPFSTGGDTAALQQEVNNIETSLGTMVDSSGNFVGAVINGLQNVDGATTLTEALQDLDAAISAAAGVDTLDELTDVVITTPATGHVLYYSAGGSWVNAAPGATSGVQAYDAALTALSNVSGTGFLVQTAADTFITTSLAASTAAGAQGVSITDASGVGDAPTIGLNISGLTAEAGTPSGTDVLPMFDGTNNVKVSVTQLKSGIVTDGITLGQLSDVTDAISGTLTIGNRYFFNATSATEKALESATLGGLNNVADGVDSASLDNVLAFDGSAWTAITVATMLADGTLDNLGDVTITANTSGEILKWNGTAWVNNTLTEAGIQALDADLTAIAAYDWTTNPGIMVMTAGGAVANRAVATASASRITVSNGNGVAGNPTLDLALVTDSNTGTFEKVTVDSYGRVTGTTAVVAGDITALVDSTYVNVSGDTMSSAADLVFVGGGVPTGLPAVAVDAADAVSKAYVDNLVASGTTWRDPVQAPNLMNIVSAQPADPTFPVQVIKYGGTQNETWTGGTALTNVVDNDILEYDVTTDTWTRIGTLSAGDRFVANGEGTAPQIGSALFGAGIRRMDLFQYVSGVPTSSASWTLPHNDNNQAIYFTNDVVSGTTTGLTNDATVYTMTVDVNGSPNAVSVVGSASQTIGTLITEINADLTGATASIVAGHIHITGTNSTDTILITDGTLIAAIGGGTGTTGNGEIRGSVEPGTTVLVSNLLSAHNGRVGFFSGGNDGDHSWVEIGGPTAINAGTGLAFNGNILNVNLGAGIVELPSDEVGLDIESGKAIQLTSSLTNGQLTLVLDGSTLSQSASGLKVASQGITATELNVSVAGDGISGGNGTALAVDYVNGSGLTMTTGQLDLSAIPNNRLANSVITVQDDASATDAIALGETLTVLGTDPINTAVAANVLTISAADATTTTKGVASFAAGDFDVTSGAVTIKAGGVDNAQLANSSITMAADTGTPDAVALGETFTVTGGTGIDTAVTANTVTVTLNATINDLSDVTIASEAAGNVLVSDGTGFDNKMIQYIHTQGSTGVTWTVTHNLGQQFCNVTVVDSSNQVIIPESITFDTANQLTVTFNTAITGKVVVMGVPGVA